MQEEWKEVSGFPNYMVSNKGRIKNIKTNNISIGSLDDSNYRRFILCNNKIKRYAKVHILVAEEFIPNINYLPEVNHKNGKHDDNRVENLEWVSHKQNMQHLLNTKGIQHNKARQIMCVETNEIFPSLRKASESKNVNKERIRVSAIDPNKRRTAAGYHWKYVEE